MRNLPYLFIFFILSVTVNAQYISEYGEIDREAIIAEIKNFPYASKEQNDFINEILTGLVSDLKDHPAIQESKEKRDFLTLTIMDMGNRRGDFAFLNPRHEQQRAREKRRAKDTINIEVLNLEERLSAMQDSIRGIYQELKVIVENEDQTRATKEKAITLFATSNELEDIEYIFENNSRLRFSNIDLDFMLFGPYYGEGRSGVNAVYLDKIPLDYVGRNNISLDHNWILFPFIIKYWGDIEWNNEIADLDLRLEFALTRRMFLSDFSKPELLIEFMRANAKDPDTPIYKMLERYY
ncbi:MAG: hypothetical protein EA362_04005 [Saprospirales bacterium]|nr:MAG: hypothetical protein EA362_04005 [Saprospirales bacterium]